MFADDTELYKSDSPSEAFTLSRTTEACISDVKVWVVQNKLQLKMTTKQRFFSSVLLLESITLLLYVWVRVTSCFPVQLVISVSFLTVSSH